MVLIDTVLVDVQLANHSMSPGQLIRNFSVKELLSPSGMMMLESSSSHDVIGPLRAFGFQCTHFRDESQFAEPYDTCGYLEPTNDCQVGSAQALTNMRILATSATTHPVITVPSFESVGSVRC